jgi:hypothetical protein
MHQNSTLLDSYILASHANPLRPSICVACWTRQ